MQQTTSRTVRTVAILAAALGLLAACGDSDDSGGDNALVEYFVSEDAPCDEAECVAGELSEFDQGEVLEVLQAEGDAPPEGAEDIVDALFGAIATCGVE